MNGVYVLSWALKKPHRRKSFGGITGETPVSPTEEKCFHFKMMGLGNPYHKFSLETKKMGDQSPPS
ncbi:hypothetical protein MSL71_14110 [Desulfoluna butyratoxydans]|uniref:Uncharacterized protein n=1 Tax=Desulfoluna butyratoxydans TaxID=231438 RepID=A0A4U8YJY5_9BACT|nr:hypothetical protein MSL71_14110 [Desulfoluna butyratoxydans]